MTLRAGVVGHPISHSLSPLIHGAWIAAAGLDATYEPFDVAPDDFAAFVEHQRGGKKLVGVNVTLPHKLAALALADELSAVARTAGAANVLLFREDGTIFADNTDGIGFIYALTQAGFNNLGPVAIIGAGGAAQAALTTLREKGVTDIRLVNRSLDKAMFLAGSDMAIRPFSLTDSAKAMRGVGLVANTTSTTTTGGSLDLPLESLAPGTVVMDMEYGKAETPLLKAARARGLPVATGLDMLIGQAIPSFAAFFKQAPDLTVDVHTLAQNELSLRP